MDDPVICFAEFIYVDSSVAVSGSGATEESPLQTIPEAIALPSQDDTPNKVKLATGFYELDETLILPENSTLIGSGIDTYVMGSPDNGGIAYGDYTFIQTGNNVLIKNLTINNYTLNIGEDNGVRDVVIAPGDDTIFRTCLESFDFVQDRGDS